MKKEVTGIANSIGNGFKLIVLIFIGFGVLLNDKCHDILNSYSNPSTPSTTVKKIIQNDRTEIYRKHLETIITELEKEKKEKIAQLAACSESANLLSQQSKEQITKLDNQNKRLENEKTILENESKAKDEKNLSLVKEYNGIIDNLNTANSQLTAAKLNNRKTMEKLRAVRTHLANTTEEVKTLNNNLEYQNTVIASLRDEIAIIKRPFYQRIYFWAAFFAGIILTLFLGLNKQTFFSKKTLDKNSQSKSRRLPLYAIMDKAASFLL